MLQPTFELYCDVEIPATTERDCQLAFQILVDVQMEAGTDKVKSAEERCYVASS